MSPSRFSTALLLALAPVLAGCQDDAMTPQKPTVTVSLSTEAPSAGKVSAAGIEVSSAKILLKAITFHSALSDDSTDVATGSIVVTLNLSGGLTQVVAQDVRPGTYDRVRFKLHKPEDFEPVPDPEFRVGSSGNERFSAVVRGTSSGAPFLFRSSESADQEVVIQPPLVVSEDRTTNLTMVVSTSQWFRGPEGTLDPLRAEDARIIEDNIKRSFESAFPDDDRDGKQ
jgi:hypothetical protein